MARRDRLKEIATLAFLLAGLVSALLCLSRIYFTLFFNGPALSDTTGSEEESLFPIWKFIQGQPVYSDPREIPYSVSFYNWLFYLVYGSIGKIVLASLHLDSVWLPTVCRFITLALAVSCCVLFFFVMRTIGADRSRPFPVLAMICCWPLICPLTAYWAISARPDMGALALETGGLLCFLHYWRDRRLRFIAGSALLFFAAWCFKQPNVSAISGTSLALLLLREWRAFAVMAGIWFSLVILTFLSGSSFYRYDTLFAQMVFPFMPDLGVKVLLLIPYRDPLLPMALIVPAFVLWKAPRSLLRDPNGLTLLCMMFCTLLLASVTVFKSGANNYYFIPAAAWSILLFFLWADRIPPRLLHVTVILCSCLLVARVVVLNFILGHEMFVSMREPYQDLQQQLAPLPGPVFINDTNGDLPWIQTKPPYFVVSSNYFFAEQQRTPYAHGGWEGLLQDGYFRTVVSDKITPLPASLLGDYEKAFEDVYWVYYRKKS